MFNPAHWQTKRINEVRSKVDEALCAPGVKFPLSVYFHDFENDGHDLAAVNTIAEEARSNGWHTTIGDGLKGVTLRIDLPVGSLYEHNAKAAHVSWGELCERVDWLTDLHSRIEGAPRIGTPIPKDAGADYVVVNAQELRRLREVDELWKNDLRQLGDLVGVDTAKVTNPVEEIISRVRLVLQPDPELKKRRAWLESLLNHLSPYSPIKLNSDLTGRRAVIMALPNDVSKDELVRISRGVFPRPTDIRIVTTPKTQTEPKSCAAAEPTSEKRERADKATLDFEPIVLSSDQRAAIADADAAMSALMRRILGADSTNAISRALCEELDAADAADIARELGAPSWSRGRS